MKTHVDSFLFVRYPVVYLILVTPISFVRWLSGFGRSPTVNIPSAATLATEFLFTLSGLANMFIFIFTRKNIFIAENTNRVQPQTIFPGTDNGFTERSGCPRVRGSTLQ